MLGMNEIKSFYIFDAPDPVSLSAEEGAFWDEVSDWLLGCCLLLYQLLLYHFFVLRRARYPAAGDDAEGETKYAWKAWMKEHITISKGIQCDVIAWWKEKAYRFPWIAKAAKLLMQSLRQRRFASVFSNGPSIWEQLIE
jgi:hypothetical protein